MWNRQYMKGKILTVVLFIELLNALVVTKHLYLFLFKGMAKVSLTFRTVKASFPRTILFSERQIEMISRLWNAIIPCKGKVSLRHLCEVLQCVFDSYLFKSLTKVRKKKNLFHNMVISIGIYTGSGQCALQI
jgi:hypothetical protein